MNKNLGSLYRIIYRENFKKELGEMHYYIKEVLKEDKIANRTVRKVIEKIKILEIFPFSSKLLKKEKDFEYRKFIIKNYIIIYKVNLKEKEVKILHIYNQREKYQ